LNVDRAMRLMFLTGSRGEWGYIRPLIRLCAEQESIDYRLCATNMHLLPNFGLTVNELIQDQITVHHKLYTALDGYTHATMAKSLGLLVSSFVDVIVSDRPDWIVLAGDRWEQMAGAIVGAFCYVPIAHIQAGEVSGNIDGMTRHAIGKYSHLHLAANVDACDRLRKLGEEEFRVHNVGAPQLDELRNGEYSEMADASQRLGINLNDEFILVVQHPVTDSAQHSLEEIRQTLSALNHFEQNKIVILPNNDAGSSLIKEGIEEFRSGNYFVFASLSRADYLCLLNHAVCIIGNSSSGLLEAPSFQTPAINLGDRQRGRVRASNVIDQKYISEEIVKTLNYVLSDLKFRDEVKKCINPYGDGRSSERILEILRSTKIDSRLLAKNLTY
jgi:GDP/UDP-N,N'-diacetylbacillosamine 2-epimerase (hydrolysing)